MTIDAPNCHCMPLDPGPDLELENRVRLYLSHAGHRPVQALTVEAHNGVITLRGRVPSYYARQLAIACAQRVAGVRQVNDQIKARWGTDSMARPGGSDFQSDGSTAHVHRNPLCPQRGSSQTE
jgi:hypothetical protein